MSYTTRYKISEKSGGMKGETEPDGSFFFVHFFERESRFLKFTEAAQRRRQIKRHTCSSSTILIRIGPWFLPTSTREAYSFGKSTNFDLLPTSIGNVRNIANELSSSIVGCSTLKIFATAFLDRCQTRVKYVLGLYKNTRSFPLAHFEHHLCLLEFLQQHDCNSVALCS